MFCTHDTYQLGNAGKQRLNFTDKQFWVMVAFNFLVVSEEKEKKELLVTAAEGKK